MNENSKKRSRKTTLVPRVDLCDTDDENIAEMQKEVENLLTEMKFGKESKQSKDPPPTMDISVKVEVEEVEEFEEPDRSTLNATTQETKIEVGLDEEINIIETDKEPDITQISNMGIAKPYIKLKVCYEIDQETIWKGIAELSKVSTNPVDRCIEMLLRNYLNKPAMPNLSALDITLQEVLAKWRDWYDNIQGLRGPPLFYKCLVCDKAWWFFSQFREHMAGHEIDDITYDIEEKYYECNIVAYTGTVKVSKDIPIQTNCWKCGVKAQNHFFYQKSNQVFQYSCKGCKLKIATCVALNVHQGKCQLFLDFLRSNGKKIEFSHECQLCQMRYMNESQLLKHMSTAHVVRSDVPMPWSKLICKFCKIPYEKSNLHDCPLRPANKKCKYCSKKFLTAYLLDLHYVMTNDHAVCRICGQYLEKECMEMNHLLDHTFNYVSLYKCLQCNNTRLYRDRESFRKHKAVEHMGYVPLELVYVSRNTLESQTNSLESETISLEVESNYQGTENYESDGAMSTEPVTIYSTVPKEYPSRTGRRRCKNCGIKLKKGYRKLRHVTDDMIKTLKRWVHPTELSKSDGLCSECVTILKSTSRKKRTKAKYGNSTACFGCGHPSPTKRVPRDSLEEKVIIGWVFPHLLPRLERVCNACWKEAWNIAHKRHLEKMKKRRKMLYRQERATRDKDNLILNSENDTGIKISDVRNVSENTGKNDLNTLETHAIETGILHNKPKTALDEKDNDVEMNVNENSLNLKRNTEANMDVCKSLYAAKDRPEVSNNDVPIAKHFEVPLIPYTKNEALEIPNKSESLVVLGNTKRLISNIKDEALEDNKSKLIENMVPLIPNIKKKPLIIVNKSNIIQNKKTLIPNIKNKALEISNKNKEIENTIPLLPNIKDKLFGLTKETEIKENARNVLKIDDRSNIETKTLASNPLLNSNNNETEFDLELSIMTNYIRKMPSPEITELPTNTQYDVGNIKITSVSCLSSNPRMFDINVQVKQEPEDPINEHNDIHEITIKEEVLDYINTGEDIDLLNHMTNEKVEVKTEPEEEFDEDLYEGDIIILNSGNNYTFEETVSMVENNEMIDDHDESTMSIEQDCSNDLEPGEINLQDSRKRKRRGAKIYKCNKCNFMGKHKEFAEHVDTVCLRKSRPRTNSNLDYGTDKYECTKCNTTFKNISSYLQHLEDHGYKRSTCPQCHYTPTRSYDLIGHLNSHIKQMFISVRVIKMSKSATKQSHKIKHRCKRCQETVETGNFFGHWEKHLLLKKDKEFDENFKCDLVEKSPALKEIMRILSEVHNDGHNQHRWCNMCSRPFARNNDCKRHFIEHLLDDAYENMDKYSCLKCQICGEGFARNDVYRSHMRFHASLPIYHCERCDKQFSDSSNFAKHKKVHNLAVLVCDICHKKFNKKFYLRKHMEIHLYTKPFECKNSQCNKVFYSESLLKKHVRSHEKFRPIFKCNICKVYFTSLKNKWDHMWVDHKQRKNIADCPLCDKSFRKFQDVRSHLWEEHKYREKIKASTIYQNGEKLKQQGHEESDFIGNRIFSE